MREILYDQVKAAQYMARLLKAKYFATEEGDNLFEYFNYMGGNLKRLLRNVIQDIEVERDVPEKQEALEQLYHAKGHRSNVLSEKKFHNIRLLTLKIISLFGKSLKEFSASVMMLGIFLSFHTYMKQIIISKTIWV